MAATGGGIWNCQVPSSLKGPDSCAASWVVGQAIDAPFPSVQDCLYSVTGLAYAAPVTESRQVTSGRSSNGEMAALLEAPYWVVVSTKKRASCPCTWASRF